jgi:GT2 family glycosyltransferase
MVARARDGDVTVVVVTWQQRDLVLDCLASVRAQSVPCRVVVVDNASNDGTREAVAASYPDVDVVVLPENRGFAGGMAAGLDHVRTRFVALLNNDAVADPDWLRASLDALADPDVAAATSKLLLLGTDRSGGVSVRVLPPIVNNAGVVLLRSGYGADRGLGEPDGPAYAEPAEVFGFSGGAAVLRTMAVRAVGGFPADWFMYYEDTDLSWRLRLAGWRIVYVPDAVVWHRHAASSDASSRLFAFHNERNRLLTLVRNAPAGTALHAAMRFAVTTGSLTLKRATGRALPPAPVFDVGLRLSVAGAAAVRMPRTLRQRRAGPRVRRRRDVLAAWSGVDERPLGTDA